MSKILDEKFLSKCEDSMAPFMGLMSIKGKPLSLKYHYPMYPLFKRRKPRRTVLRCGRQVGKSIQLGFKGTFTSRMTPYLHTLFVQPRYDQIKRFSNNYVKVMIETGVCPNSILDYTREQSINQRSLKGGSDLYFSYAFLSPDRCRGFSFGNLYIDECQDINHEFIPVIGEAMSAETEYGFYEFSGTPKSHQNTLQRLFSKSSQAFYHIKCHHCNAENIPNEDHHIYKMIGKNTCICYKCGKPLDLFNGRFIHHYPDRRSTFEGYHLSQTTHPLHACIIGKWHELLKKYEEYEPAVFANEVLGIPADTEAKPITEADLKEACGGHDNLVSEAAKDAKNSPLTVMGVDWSGFGSDQTSSTAYTQAVSLANSDKILVTYMGRIKSGKSPEEEADEILYYTKQTHSKLLAHDYTGAGMIREALINQRGFPAKKIIPFSLVCAPVKHKIMEWYKPTGGSRACYNIDKARSLAILCQMIKKKKIIFPKWDSCKHILKDLLNLTQETKETQSGGSLFLMGKAPGTTDDFAHALNFACSAIWHSSGKYPRWTQSLTEEDYMLMDPQGYDKIVNKNPSRAEPTPDKSKKSHQLDW